MARTTKKGSTAGTGKTAAEPKTKATAATAKRTKTSTKSTPATPTPTAAKAPRAARSTARRPRNGHAADAPSTANGVAGISHEQVAARAYELWLRSGCVPGRDAENWREAEAQLRAEHNA